MAHFNCLLVIVSLALAAPVRSQPTGFGGDPKPQAPPDAHLIGIWNGQWNLTDTINEGLVGESWHWEEITHAICLPPPNDGWTLLICARYCAICDFGPPCDLCMFQGAEYGPQSVFLWDHRDPQNIYRVPIDAPLGGEHGNADMFCSGHNLSPDGHPVVFGGTDLEECDTNPSGVVGAGHSKVWIMNNQTAIEFPMMADPIFPEWI